MEQFHAFRSAIRWTEPFVLGIIGFQLLMFGLSLWASQKNRGMVPRLIILVFIGVVVRSAEYVNNYMAQEWENLGITQNYFDRRGIFIGIMLCAPLIVNCLMMLFMFLREASQLLVEVKRNEIKQKKKNNQNSTKQQPNPTNNNGTTTNTNSKKKKNTTTKTRKED